MSAPFTIRIQQADFDVAHESALLTAGRTDIGAVVSFLGICRGTEGGCPVGNAVRARYGVHGGDDPPRPTAP